MTSRSRMAKAAREAALREVRPLVFGLAALVIFLGVTAWLG